MRGLAALAMLAGCFGGGPAPHAGSDVSVAFAIPDDGDCALTGYLGDIVVNGGSGLVVVAPNANQGCGNNNNSGGNNNNENPTDVVGFSLGGGSSTTFAVEGADGAERVAWLAGVPVLAFATQSANTLQVQLGTGTPAAVFPDGTLGSPGAADIVADDTGAWIAAYTINNMTYFDDTDFPNDQPAFDYGGNGQNGGNNNGNNNVDAFAILAADGTITNEFISVQNWFCSSMPDCLVQNASTVFGMVRANQGSTNEANAMSAVVAFDKATGSADTDFSVFALIPQLSIGGNAVGPTGMAADGSNVMWTLSPDVDQDDEVGCMVFVQPVSGGSAKQLLSTTAFSCAGGALDGSAAYVAITHAGEGDDTNVELAGRGIARLGFDGSYASLATRITGAPYAGPRRVYVVDNGGDEDLMAVDPHAIGLIPESAIEGRNDVPHE